MPQNRKNKRGKNKQRCSTFALFLLNAGKTEVYTHYHVKNHVKGKTWNSCQRKKVIINAVEYFLQGREAESDTYEHQSIGVDVLGFDN